MPIKPENRCRYPEDWSSIRARILKRACDCCELCGAMNGSWITRNAVIPGVHYPAREVDPGAIKVILTIAHLDPTYQCHDEKCLLALCQRCHLKIDAHLRHVARKMKGQSNVRTD